MFEPGYCSCGHHRSDQCEECKALIAGKTPPEIEVDQGIRAVLAAADDLIILANREDTRSLVCKEKIALGQLLTRVETLCSFALAVRPAPLLVRQRVS